MADPITLAVLGGTIGAATNKDDPLKGALLGAAGGYFGGSTLGNIKLEGGIGNLINGIGTNAAAGGNVGQGLAMNASMLAGSQGASAAMAGSPFVAKAATPAASSAMGSVGSGFSQVGMPSLVNANPFTANAAFAAPVPPPAELTMMDKLMGYGGQAMSALNSNPVVAQMGMGMMQTAMQPRPPGPVLQGQIQRGQIAAPQFGGARVAQRRPMSLLG